MKAKVIWVLRHLLIPLAFIWATGIIGGIYNLETLPKASINDRFSKEELSTLEMFPRNARAYSDSLIKARRKHIEQTGMYEPYLYFHDLKQFNMFEALYADSLNNTLEGRIISMPVLSGGCVGGRGEIANMMMGNWRNINWDEISKNNPGCKQCMNKDDAMHYWFPMFAKADAENAKHPTLFWADIMVPILTWLLGIYLKGLPIALLLFLIWRIKFKEDSEDAVSWRYENIKRPEFNTGFEPLSFLISLIFWPVIVYIDVRNRWSSTLRKAEMFSRRKNMLSLLSDQERQLLEISKKMSLKEFRDHLQSLGVVRRHSFAAGLVIVIFLHLMPHTINASPVKYCDQVSKTVTITDYGGVNNSVSHYENISLCDVAVIPDKVETYVPDIIYNFYYLFFKVNPLAGFTRTIGKVPKFTNQISLN